MTLFFTLFILSSLILSAFFFIKRIETKLEKRILISEFRNKFDIIFENIFLAIAFLSRKIWDTVVFEFKILPKRFGKWTHRFWMWLSRRIDIFFEKMRQKRFGKKVEKY